MLVVDPENTIIGWLDHRVDPWAQSVTVLLSKMDWDDLMTSGAYHQDEMTEALRIPIGRLEVRHRLDPWVLEACNLDPRQLGRESVDLAQIVRVLAGRHAMSVRALIMAEAPDHTRVSVSNDVQTMAQIIRVDAFALRPQESEIEQLFDAPGFIALDEADYMAGDLHDLLNPGRSRPSGGGGGAVAMAAPSWYGGLQVMRPKHIGITSIS